MLAASIDAEQKGRYMDALLRMYTNYFKERAKRKMAAAEGVDRPPRAVRHRLDDFRWVWRPDAKKLEHGTDIIRHVLYWFQDPLLVRVLRRHVEKLGEKNAGPFEGLRIDAERGIMKDGVHPTMRERPSEAAVATAEIFPSQLYEANDDTLALRFFDDFELVGWPDYMFVPGREHVRGALRARMREASPDDGDLDYMTWAPMSAVRAAVEELAAGGWVEKITPAFVGVEMPDGQTALHVKLLCRQHPPHVYWKRHPRAMYDRMYWLTEDTSNVWNCKASYKVDDYEGVRHTDRPGMYMVKKNGGRRWQRFKLARRVYAREMKRRSEMSGDELELARAMDEATDVGPAGVRFKEDFDEFLDQVPTEALDERYVYPESPAKMLDYDMQEWARTRGRAAQPWGLVPDRLGRRCLSSRGGNWLPKSKWNWRAIKPDNYKMNTTDPWYNDANRASNREEMRVRYSGAPGHPLFNESPGADETVRAFFPWLAGACGGSDNRRNLTLEAFEEMRRELPWYMKGVELEEAPEERAPAARKR